MIEFRDTKGEKRDHAIILAALRTLHGQIHEKGGQSLPLGILDILKDHTCVLDDEVAFCQQVEEICESISVGEYWM